VTQECLRLGIAEVKPGARVGDIGAAIQEYAEAQGFSVVRDFAGHGVSNYFPHCTGNSSLWHTGQRQASQSGDGFYYRAND
jgi:methionine aminopeptidase